MARRKVHFRVPSVEGQLGYPPDNGHANGDQTAKPAVRQTSRPKQDGDDASQNDSSG